MKTIAERLRQGARIISDQEAIDQTNRGIPFGRFMNALCKYRQDQYSAHKILVAKQALIKFTGSGKEANLAEKLWNKAIHRQ
ncbi:MAG: hypothetical protein V1858_02435 [Candidatus Gottesmanbacteria bacterium]